MLSGELRPGAIESLWEEISAGGMSGVLSVESGKERWEFLFRTGVFIGAHKQGVSPGDRIIDLLLESGVLRHETVRDAIKKQSRVMKSCVEILMEEGHVPLILYSRTLSALMRLHLLDALARTKGFCQFAARNDLREDAGAKPLTLADFNRFRDYFANDRRLLKQLLAALFLPVTVLERKSFPLDRKSLFYSYATQDRDLLDFLVQMGEMTKEGMLVLDRGIAGVGSRDLVAVLVLRALAVALVAAMVISALAAEHSKDRHEMTLYQKAALVNVALVRDMFRFDTGEESDVSRLLRAGLLTPEEALLWEKATENTP